MFLATVLPSIGNKKVAGKTDLLQMQTAEAADRDVSYHPPPFTVYQLCDRYPLICVAEVIKAKLTPGFWPGTFICTMPAEYKVIRVLKGKCDKPIITVHHRILCPNARVTKHASLAKKFFIPGRLVILCLRCDEQSNNRYEDDGYDECVQQFSKDLEEKFLEALALQKIAQPETSSLSCQNLLDIRLRYH